jgi:hypothetical protein
MLKGDVKAGFLDPFLTAKVAAGANGKGNLHPLYRVPCRGAFGWFHTLGRAPLKYVEVRV